MGKRILRYHKDVLFPSWIDQSFDEYRTAIYSDGPLTFSAHGLYKVCEYMIEYGRSFIKKIEAILVAGAVERDNLFEFYADKENKIQKACFRYSVGLLVDIIFVVSRDCTVITVYTTDTENSHEFLNKKAYVRKEK